MTRPKLADITQRAEAATEGPWEAYTVPAFRHEAAYVAVGVGETEVRVARFEGGYFDAAFIAHARTDVPALSAAIREAQARTVPTPRSTLMIESTTRPIVDTESSPTVTTAPDENNADPHTVSVGTAVSAVNAAIDNANNANRIHGARSTVLSRARSSNILSAARATSSRMRSAAAPSGIAVSNSRSRPSRACRRPSAVTLGSKLVKNASAATTVPITLAHASMPTPCRRRQPR